MNPEIKEIIQKSVERLESTTCDEATARKIVDELEKMSFGDGDNLYTISPMKMIMDSWNIEAFLDNHFAHVVTLTNIIKSLEAGYYYHRGAMKSTANAIQQEIKDVEAKGHVRAVEQDGHTQGTAKHGWCLYEDLKEEREELKVSLKAAEDHLAAIEAAFKSELNFVKSLRDLIDNFADRIPYIKSHGRAGYESWFQEEFIDTFVEHVKNKETKEQREEEYRLRAEFADDYSGGFRKS